MNKAVITWKFILDQHSRGHDVILLYVLDSMGSSPGRKGFFMAVSENGDMNGSIGGGIMEHKFAELSKEILKKPSQYELPIIKKQYHDKEAAENQSGMICSGEQTIYINLVSDHDIIAIRALINSLSNARVGMLGITLNGLYFQEENKNAQDKPSDESQWLYKEQTGYINHLYIIGGGHCSLALSRIFQDMDFFIHVYDDRPGLNTMEENRFAHEKIILKHYDELKDIIREGDNHYVVLMTLGYRTDEIALKALSNKQFAYLGVLGSAFKINKMMESLRIQHEDTVWLARLKAPIGIDISSQTPDEIAISIAAEIIREKNSNLKSGRSKQGDI